MRKILVSEIAQRFIRYYQDQGFEVQSRCSLLDPSLPMTFVMSAGRMHIDRAIENGEYRPEERYVLLQPCFRHYDLEKVGRSLSHLSLFEMAGAYCFGKPGRKEMLEKIWHFLRGELGIPRERLWVTYFAGGELDEYQFQADTETVQVLEKIGVSASQIVGLGVETNLLKEGGISGKKRFCKCGAMVEFFFDRGLEGHDGHICQPGCACERFIEIANTLFIYSQFDQETQTLQPFSTPFAETVIGIERIAMSLQEGSSVFETVRLNSLIELIQSYHHETAFLDVKQQVESERVVVDHIRALVFLVADNAPPPGKGGRAWIIKKLVRGVLTHQKVLAIVQTDFILNLIDTVLNLYKNQYPELKKARSTLLEYFEEESKCFENTLSAGCHHLDKIIRESANNLLNGRQVLELVKRYGFPFPLLEKKLAQMGINFDKQKYREAYTNWQQMSQS